MARTIDGLTLEPVDLDMVLEVLHRRIPDRSVWVFGSRANGKARKYSDLDLVIQGSEALPNDVYAQLVEDFDESNLPIRVDILDWNRIDDDFKPYILQRYITLV
jgi:type I restriction enzyme S subunit